MASRIFSLLFAGILGFSIIFMGCTTNLPNPSPVSSSTPTVTAQDATPNPSIRPYKTDYCNAAPNDAEKTTCLSNLKIMHEAINGHDTTRCTSLTTTDWQTGCQTWVTQYTDYNTWYTAYFEVLNPIPLSPYKTDYCNAAPNDAEKTTCLSNLKIMHEAINGHDTARCASLTTTDWQTGCQTWVTQYTDYNTWYTAYFEVNPNQFNITPSLIGTPIPLNP